MTDTSQFVIARLLGGTALTFWRTILPQYFERHGRRIIMDLEYLGAFIYRNIIQFSPPATFLPRNLEREPRNIWREVRIYVFDCY